jgi:hypothetical protein
VGQNLCPHAVDIADDLVRPTPNHPPPFAVHHLSATRVGFDLKCMMLAIDLDDELLLHAGEVGEVRTDRMLTSELAANELAIAKQAPNQTFCIACLVPSSRALSALGFAMTHLTLSAEVTPHDLSPHEDVGGEGT